MNDLTHNANGNGSIEVYGASVKLTDELTRNYAERGRMAGTLLVATLTETPYFPVDYGDNFSVDVSNVFHNPDDPEDKTAKDTVEVAKEALAEFMAAPVAGAKSLGLDVVKTEYDKLLDALKPGRKTSKPYVDTFDEAFVESARSSDVELRDPEQGKRLIVGAPKKIGGLLLTYHSNGWLDPNKQTHEMVTVDGRIVTVISQKHGITSFSGERTTYAMPKTTSDLHYRGGKAPRADIAHVIERRVVDLRTNYTKRG